MARIKARTIGFSPAQIDHVIREAKYEAVKRDSRSREVTFEDLDLACYQVKYGAKKRDMPETWEGSDDRKRTAWHEAGHALLRQLLIPEQSIDLVTIIPHESGALGFVAWNPDEESYSHSKMELMDELAVLLLVAKQNDPDLDNSERGVNSETNSDLKQATRMTFAAITQYGLDEGWGSLLVWFT